MHILPATIAIIVSSFQFNPNLRHRFLNFHRWNGRIYVICSLIGAIGGFGLSFKSYGGLSTHLGFGLLAILWFSSTVIAVYYIKYAKQDNETDHEKQNRIKQHKLWMIRSFAFIMAAPSLRVFLPIFEINNPLYDSYNAISWFCWVPNIIIAEIYIYCLD